MSSWSVLIDERRRRARIIPEALSVTLARHVYIRTLTILSTRFYTSIDLCCLSAPFRCLPGTATTTSTSTTTSSTSTTSTTTTTTSSSSSTTSTTTTTTTATPTGTGLTAKFAAHGKKYWGTCSDQALLQNAQNYPIVQAQFGQLTPENSMKVNVLSRCSILPWTDCVSHTVGLD